MTEEINKAVSTLQKGGLLLYPTDTIWGIGCDALNNKAIGRIFRLKNRADHKSLIILLAEARDIFKYVAAPPPDILSILESFQRPTTVIYEQAVGLPDNLIGGNGSIGIRVTKDVFCKRLIKKFGFPIVSTSANPSGMPSPKGFADIHPSIKEGVDDVVNYRRDEVSENSASKIIKINSDGTRVVLRE